MIGEVTRQMLRRTKSSWPHLCGVPSPPDKQALTGLNLISLQARMANKFSTKFETTLYKDIKLGFPFY